MTHFAELSGLIAPFFSGRDLRSNATAYIRGLLCGNPAFWIRDTTAEFTTG